MISLVSSFLLGTGLADTISTEKNDKAEKGFKKNWPTISNPSPFGPYFPWGGINPPPKQPSPKVLYPFNSPIAWHKPFVVKQTSSDDELEMPSMTAKEFVEFYNSLSEDEKHAVDGVTVNWEIGYDDGHFHIKTGGEWTPGQKQQTQQNQQIQIPNMSQNLIPNMPNISPSNMPPGFFG